MCTVAKSLSSAFEADLERLGSDANRFSRSDINIEAGYKGSRGKASGIIITNSELFFNQIVFTREHWRGCLVEKFLAAYLRQIQVIRPTSKRNLMTQPCPSTSLSNSSVHSALLSSSSRAARQFAHSWTIAAMSGTKVSGSGSYFCRSCQSREKSVSTSTW